MLTLPKNAETLIALRTKRGVPELPVLVSLVGKLDFENLTLIASPAERYDWQCLADLHVEVFVSERISFDRVVRVLAEIASAVPAKLVVQFVDGPRIDCGDSRVVRHVDGDFALFDWFPIVVQPMASIAGATVVRKLYAAISDGTIPTPFEEAMSLVMQIAGEQQCA